MHSFEFKLCESLVNGAAWILYPVDDGDTSAHLPGTLPQARDAATLRTE